MIYLYIYLIGIIPSFILTLHANYYAGEKVKLIDILALFFINLIWPVVLPILFISFLCQYVNKKEVIIPFSKHKTITKNITLTNNDIDKLKKYII